MTRRSGANRRTHGKSAFYRLGALAVRRRWVVLAVWIVAFLAVGPFLGKLNARLSQGGFEVPGSQSDQVRRAVETEFKGQFEFSDLLVMHSDSLAAQDPTFRRTFDAVRSALRRAPGVGAVSDAYASPERSISRDGHTLWATVGLTDNQDEALHHADDLNAAVARASRGRPLQALLTGAAPFYSVFSQTTTHDLERAEKVALPISLLILILAFGSLVAAGMPLALALLSLAISFGVISAIAATTTVSIFAQNVASMIGIGVGIDYSLFILNRYREGLRAGLEPTAAVGEAIATSGKAVFVSGLTVVVALSGTQLVNLAAFRSMGFSAMIAVFFAMAAALTLLPALLGFVGRKVDSLSLHRRKSEESRMWHRWATWVMRRPWPALLVSLAIVALLAAPALHLRLGSSGPSILPAGSGPRVAAEITARAFGEGQVAPVQVMVTDQRGVTGPGFADLYRLAGEIAKDPEVARVDSIATLIPGAPVEQAQAALASPQAAPFVKSLVASGGKKTLLSLISKHGAQSDESNGLVLRLRSQLPSIVPTGVIAAVGGDPGLNVDINHEMESKLIPVVALVLVLSFLVLLVFLRSLLLPLKAILMNTASVLAAYGLMVFVFQDGHFTGLLDFDAAHHVDSFLPLFLFCILFGLSMDYEVFLLARIREEYLRTGDNTEAVGWGLEHTARIITSAAAIMVTVFGAFAFARMLPIKELGFGLAAAVLLDATIIRVIMVPATMRLMGKWNWWLPRWLDRLLPKVSLEAAEEVPGERVPTPV
ncbi:MAG TPA: MMPL family transporter [Actinomycetota bacterium]|nr:MMPL family transporter [Actinomycetota bacterium]